MPLLNLTIRPSVQAPPSSQLSWICHYPVFASLDQWTQHYLRSQLQQLLWLEPQLPSPTLTHQLPLHLPPLLPVPSSSKDQARILLRGLQQHRDLPSLQVLTQRQAQLSRLDHMLPPPPLQNHLAQAQQRMQTAHLLLPHPSPHQPSTQQTSSQSQVAPPPSSIAQPVSRVKSSSPAPAFYTQPSALLVKSNQPSRPQPQPHR